MSSYGVAEATRIVPASAADIFELLATPAKHPLIDGSNTVLGRSRVRRTACRRERSSA